MHRGESSYLISADIGTSGVKTILCQVEGRILAEERESYRTYYPRPGFAEQDPEEVLAAVVAAIRRLLGKASVPPASIAAVVFGGIWNSLLPIDINGEPLCRGMTWADLRSIPQNERLRRLLDDEDVKSATGCALHPMYFLSRLQWLREEAPDIFKRADRFVSVKEYVIGRLYGTRKVDYSMASGTGVWNMKAMDWDEALLAVVGLSSARFSDCVEPATSVRGLRAEFAAAMGLLAGTPGIVGAADGALAHLGSVGLAEERMSLSIGTSVALRMRIPEPCVRRGREAWCYYLADGNWLLGGVLHDGGNTLRWLWENMIAESEAEPASFGEMDRMAGGVPPGSEGLFFLPLLGGERCPHYVPEARGTLHGLAFNHTRRHIVRSLMEGLAYSMRSVYRMLAVDSAPELVATGGILKSSTWMQIVADFLGKTLWLPGVDESTAWGGVILGLRAIGAYPNLEEASKRVTIAGRRDPDPERREEYLKLGADYDRLYERLYGN
jgi:gluconokinase